MHTITAFVASDHQDQEWYQRFATALAHDVSVSTDITRSDVCVVPVTGRPLAPDHRTLLYNCLNQRHYLLGILRAPAPRHTWPIIHHLLEAIDAAPTETAHRVALTLTHLGDQIHPPAPLITLAQGHSMAIPERIKASMELVAMMQPSVLHFFTTHVANQEDCNEMVSDTFLAITAILRRDPKQAAGMSPEAFVMHSAHAQLRTYRRPTDHRWDQLR